MNSDRKKKAIVQHSVLRCGDLKDDLEAACNNKDSRYDKRSFIWN